MEVMGSRGRWFVTGLTSTADPTGDPEVERADRAPVPYQYPSSYATGLGATVNGLATIVHAE